MYNEAQKMKYIQENINRRIDAEKSYSIAFEKVAIFEEKLGKDCCDFNAAEIIDFYSFLCTPSLQFLNDRNSVYAHYTTFCIGHNLVKDNINHWKEMTREVLMSCVNNGLIEKQIVTREELLQGLASLNNPSDIALPLAIFEGFNGKLMCDLTDLTEENINGNICHINGKNLKMSPELKEYFLQSIEEDKYYARNGKTLPFEPSNKVFKDQMNCQDGADTQINKRKRLYNRLMRIKEDTGMECIALMSLRESGRIHMLRQYQKEHNCSFKEAMYKTNRYSDIYGGIRSISEYMLHFGIED